MQRQIRKAAASLLVVCLTKSVLAVPVGEYRVAAGCAAREVFEQQLERRLQQPGELRGVLDVVVESVDGTYIGRAGLRSKTGATWERVVVNQACDPVLQALALVGAVLLESELPAEPEPKPRPSEPASVPNAVPQRVESHEVVIAPSKTQKPSKVIARAPERWVTGPLFGLTADGQFAPDLRFGPRLGWSLTHHALVAKSQVELSVSFARLGSGSLNYAERNADISWNSVRFDACLGSGAQTISTIGGCALFDLGQLQGTGRVGSLVRTQTSLWSRIGAALHARQALIGALALDGKLGAMLATRRQEFYFAAAEGLSEQAVHQTPRLGLVADLLLDLHFW